MYYILCISCRKEIAKRYLQFIIYDESNYMLIKNLTYCILYVPIFKLLLQPFSRSNIFHLIDVKRIHRRMAVSRLCKWFDKICLVVDFLYPYVRYDETYFDTKSRKSSSKNFCLYVALCI